MLDLYACALRFDGDPGVVFERVRERIENWVGKSYSDASHLIGELDGTWRPDKDIEIRWDTTTSPDGSAARWSLSWRRPVPDEPSASLSVKARVQRTSEQASAWFRIVAATSVRQIRPVQVPWTRPPVVRSLVKEQRVSADGRRLLDEPASVGVTSLKQDLLPLLLDPERSLPVVVISLPLDAREPLVDAGKLAGLLAGIAHVFLLSSKEAAQALSSAIGRPRAVYEGAVRLYWPGFSTEGDPHDHPLFQRREIASLRSRGGSVAEHLLRTVGQIAALHAPETWLDLDFKLIDAQERKRNRRAARERFRQEGASDEFLRHLRELESANDQFALEYDRQDAMIDNLQAQVLDLEMAKQQAFDELRRRAHAARAAGPASVYEAVRFAQEDCRRLVFLPEAFESAYSSQYQQPERLYEAFLTMDRIAGRYASGALPHGLGPAFSDEGLDLAKDISDTAKKRYRAEYLRRYGGNTIMLGPHLRIGGGGVRTMMRVYFAIDDVERVFVVGHVGKHLRDASNK